MSHLIGHEGHGSLLSELKSRQLCSSLVSYHDSNDGFGFFHIGVDLTEDALNRLDEITQIVFQYIKMLQVEGPKEYIFNENKELDNIKFNFKEKSNPIDYVQHLSYLIHVRSISNAFITLVHFPLNSTIHLKTYWLPITLPMFTIPIWSSKSYRIWIRTIVWLWSLAKALRGRRIKLKNITAPISKRNWSTRPS